MMAWAIAGCGTNDAGDNSNAPAPATSQDPAATNTPAADTASTNAVADPISDALAAALADCFDPLHDSDGSGGFFELCERAHAAKVAGQLDCMHSSFEPGNAACEPWRVDEAEIPPYYFNRTADDPEQSGPEIADSTTEVEPAAAVDQAPTDSSTGFPTTAVVLEWNEYGGCQLAQRCTRYTVFGDGRVEAADHSGEVRNTGKVEIEIVAEVMNNADVDSRTIVNSLGHGACISQVDGIDQELVVAPAGLRVNTCDYNLSESDDPLIARSVQLALAATEAAKITDWN